MLITEEEVYNHAAGHSSSKVSIQIYLSALFLSLLTLFLSLARNIQQMGLTVFQNSRLLFSPYSSFLTTPLLMSHFHSTGHKQRYRK